MREPREVRSGLLTRSGLEKLAIAAALASLAGVAATSCSSPDRPESIEHLEFGLGSPVTISFQNGVAPSASYAGTSDTSLKQVAPTTNYANETTLYADGDDGSGVDLSALIEWSLSGIPAGSVVQSASLTVRITNATSNTYNIYGMVRPWSESQATWQNATSSTPWATAGALGATSMTLEIATST